MRFDLYAFRVVILRCVNNLFVWVIMLKNTFDWRLSSPYLIYIKSYQNISSSPENRNFSHQMAVQSKRNGTSFLSVQNSFKSVLLSFWQFKLFLFNVCSFQCLTVCQQRCEYVWYCWHFFFLFEMQYFINKVSSFSITCKFEILTPMVGIRTLNYWIIYFN